MYNLGDLVFVLDIGIVMIVTRIHHHGWITFYDLVNYENVLDLVIYTRSQDKLRKCTL
jgi:hypothetical protein